MTAVTKTVLKSYFETGDKPTQSQFSDLIDTFITEASAGGVTGGVLTVTSSANPTNGFNLYSGVVSAEQVGFYAGGKLQAVVKNNAISGDTNAVNYLVFGGGDDTGTHAPPGTDGHVIIAASGANSDITMRIQSTGPNGQLHFYQNGTLQVNFGISGTGSEAWGGEYLNFNAAHDGIGCTIAVQQSAGSGIPMEFNMTGSAGYVFYSRNKRVKQLELRHVTSAKNNVIITPSVSSGTPKISVSGDGATSLEYEVKGLASHIFSNSSGARYMAISGSADSVTYLSIKAATSGADGSISTQGTDSTAGFNLFTSGTGAVDFLTQNKQATHLRVRHTSSALNFVSITGAVSGGSPAISVSGAQNNIPLLIHALGSADVKVGNDPRQGLALGVSALSTSAISGFLWIPSCPGSAAGTPLAAPYVNSTALVYDSTNNFLWANCGGTWRASPSFGTGGATGTFSELVVTSVISAAGANATLNTLTASGITLNTNASINMGTGSTLYNVVLTVNASGTTQGTAELLGKNAVSIVGTITDGAATGIALRSGQTGLVQYVINGNASANLWPCTGGQINALASNAAFGMAANTLYTVVHTRASGYSVK